VSLEKIEGCPLLVRRSPVDARQLLIIEAFPEPYGFRMVNFPRQSDRLGDDMIRRQKMIR
jgi:hypothetical protein